MTERYSAGRDVPIELIFEEMVGLLEDAIMMIL